ncbi:TrkA family potassium uptake protein [Roseivirga sp. BDSF3-8]|uniref:potassium channel family protein n=1 Tax=Roseivirga sp. BDSF3-8 TaxID=3241598 RepID=UPI0035323C17
MLKEFFYNKNFRRLIYAILLLFLSLLVGCAGYCFIEGYSLLEAFYMSMLTMSTVGFNEVRQLSQAGQLFTSLYILANIIIFAYAVSVIATFIFEGELQKIFKTIISDKKVRELENHIIVCGLGRNGLKACEELRRSDQPFVIIENDEDIVDRVAVPENFPCVPGDATSDEVLKSAGIEKAKCIITTLSKDADNVFISLTARELNPSIYIISRSSEESSEKKLLRAGADRVVMPDALGGLHMAQLVTKPYVIEFLDLLSGVGGYTEKLMLEEVGYHNVLHSYRDKSISELDVRKNTGATIIAITDRSRNGFQFNPSGSTRITEGVVLIILGKKGEIDGFRKHYTNISV